MASLDAAHGGRRQRTTAINSPPGCHIPRNAWAQLNRLRTGHGRFNANLHRMVLAEDKNCLCGDIQSASHILYHCTVLALPCSMINTTNEDLIEYIRNSFFKT